jgi:hypothetical protein
VDGPAPMEGGGAAIEVYSERFRTGTGIEKFSDHQENLKIVL